MGQRGHGKGMGLYMGERRDIYIILVGKPEGKRPLGSTQA